MVVVVGRRGKGGVGRTSCLQNAYHFRQRAHSTAQPAPRTAASTTPMRHLDARETYWRRDILNKRGATRARDITH